MHIPLRIKLTVVFVSLAAWPASAVSPQAPVEKDFIVTAYYSPQPGQCCYVRGSYEADKELNGDGTHGADGTAVYEGMAAAPKSYTFGTQIFLSGLGLVTVHDRGGAITDKPDDVDRLDLWVGKGEEGLARALAFGVQHVHAMVYAPGTVSKQTSIRLALLPSSLNMLKSFLADAEPDLLSVEIKKGDTGFSVGILQDHLRTAGTFERESTGTFGDATVKALRSFEDAMGLKDEPSDQLTKKTAAYLVAVSQRTDDEKDLADLDTPGPKRIATLQRTLRFLGFYRGRTDGQYGPAIRSAIIAFQKEAGLVGDEQSPGAGVLGPLTHTALLTRWRTAIIGMHAQKILEYHRVGEVLVQRDATIDSFMKTGAQGAQVRLLQQFLAHRGYLRMDRVTGMFGGDTRTALIAYQLERKVIGSSKDRGAGTVGPATLAQLKNDEQDQWYKLIRAEGWKVL